MIVKKYIDISNFDDEKVHYNIVKRMDELVDALNKKKKDACDVDNCDMYRWENGEQVALSGEGLATGELGTFQDVATVVFRLVHYVIVNDEMIEKFEVTDAQYAIRIDTPHSNGNEECMIEIPFSIGMAAARNTKQEKRNTKFIADLIAYYCSDEGSGGLTR